MRKYQRLAVEYCTQHLISNGNSLLVCATGGGKSAMLGKVAEFLIKSAGCKRVYVLVGRDKINQQNKEEIRTFAKGVSVSEYSGRLKSLHGQVVCMTTQTAALHYDRLPMPDAVLIDEAAHARAASYETVIEHWNPKYLFGCTATPERGDKKSLVTLFDNFYQVTSRELIEMNFLCRPEFHDFECDVDDEQQIRQAITTLPLLPGKTIHFCRDHSYARRLVDVLRNMGYTTAYLMSGGENESEYALFKSDECDHLVNVDIATEGYNEPRITNVFNWCSDGTRGRWVQKVGRGLRPYVTKKFCRIFDCGGNIGDYGDLDFTEVLPKEYDARRAGGRHLVIGDVFGLSSDLIELPPEEDEDKEKIQFRQNGATMPYSPPAGWFSFFDTDYGTVFLQNDGTYAQFRDPANNQIKTVQIRLDAPDFDLGDLGFGKPEKTDILNPWQLKNLADTPTFGFTPQQADAVLMFKEWKKRISG